MNDKRAARANRIKLLALFAMFFVPVLTAWVLVLNGWRPAGTVNHGTLVVPPAPVLADGLLDAAGAPLGGDFFAGHWTVLLADPGACGDDCRRQLDVLGRVHVALNKDQDRLRMALLVPADVPEASSPVAELALVRAPRGVLQGWKPADQVEFAAVHMIDPAGFRMMVYPLPLDGSGLLKDLRRLLRLSDEDTERLRKPEER